VRIFFRDKILRNT